MIRARLPHFRYVLCAAGLAIATGGAVPMPVAAQQTANPGSAASAASERSAALRERGQVTRSLLLDEAQHREEWQANYRSLLVAFSAAFAEQEASRVERSKARQDHRRRGAARRQSDERIEAAAQQRQAAFDQLADFNGRARAEMIEPSWLRRVEEEFPELLDALPDRG